jgi:predicted nucleotidyltransferase
MSEEDGAMVESELAVLIQKAVAVLKTAGAREVHLFGSAANGTIRGEIPDCRNG